MITIDGYAEPKLPECVGNQSSIWNDCRGAIVKNLSAYVGEFKNGLPEGYGTFTYSDGAVYVGSFKEMSRPSIHEHIFSNFLENNSR